MRETTKQKERREAIEHLRKVLKPGDKVYGIVRSVSRSGMSRTIDFFTFAQRDSSCAYPGCGEGISYHLHSKPEDCPGCLAPRDHHDFRPGLPSGPIDRVYLSGWIATALDYRRDRSGALKVQGCGMDMIFHVVYNLSRTLFPEGFGVTCAHCGARPTFPDEGRQMWGASCPGTIDGTRKHGHEFFGRNGDRSGWDKDGGYALKHEQL